MTDKKILLLALLFLAGCASDPMEESGGKEAPAAAMRKIVNAPANAARGELLIYFDGDAVGTSNRPPPLRRLRVRRRRAPG